MSTHIAVVSITSTVIRYCGTCLYTAAVCLNPGTTYAQGDTKEEAVRRALSSAEMFRANGHE